MAKLLLFNKPYGVLSQFTDKMQRPTLKDFIPHAQFYPIGRLDYDSEGLLLLTTDGRLHHKIASPKHQFPKVYYAQVEGVVSEPALEQLSHGVDIKGGMTLPAIAKRIEEPNLWERIPAVRFRKSIPTSWISLTIVEGRNRQVRKMTAAVGFPTLRLVRVAVGPWTLQKLQPGDWQMLHRVSI